MTPSVIITPAAQLDTVDAIAWYESKHPDLSYDFRLALDAALSMITRYPDSCPFVAPALRRVLLRRFPHAVYYRHQKDLIQVIAILHTSRSPRIWQARDH
jgi:plasmid stabilization system protein ParE